MIKFPEIVRFSKIIKYIQHYHPDIMHITYVGRIKLHGTNAGIRYLDGKFIPQCRSRPLVNDDNQGFAAFVNSLSRETLTNLFEQVCSDCFFYKADITIFGEWIGKGIQGSNIAIGNLEKQFVIFNYYEERMGFYPVNELDARFDESNIFGIDLVPAYSVHIDFNSPESSIRYLEDFTKQVEEECPYAKYFGVKGLGEGLVWQPYSPEYDHHFWFKTKGEKHSGKFNKLKIEIDPVVRENILKLVDDILPEWRLQQGIILLIQENKEIVIKNIGFYLKWINCDVRKEEMDTIEANGFEWKQLSTEINRRAKGYFLKAIDDDIS